MQQNVITIGNDIMKVHRKNNPGKQKVFVDIDETICFYENDKA